VWTDGVVRVDERRKGGAGASSQVGGGGGGGGGGWWWWWWGDGDEGLSGKGKGKGKGKGEGGEEGATVQLTSKHHLSDPSALQFPCGGLVAWPRIMLKQGL
jgi:hypothetical protein